jgi:hypothetical protein
MRRCSTVNSHSHRICRILSVGLFLFMAQQGCTHQVIPPSPLPETIQQRLGKMGVVVRDIDKSEFLISPGKGRLNDMGRGAMFGTMIGVNAGLQSGYAAPILVPIGAAVGLVGGSIYGAAASESWSAAETQFDAILGDLKLNLALPEHLIDFSRSHGQKIEKIPYQPDDDQQNSLRTVAEASGIDTIMEIHPPTVTLSSAELEVNPYRRLSLYAPVRLLSTTDGSVLDERIFTDELGPTLSLSEWTINNSARFREEVHQAADRLAQQIITDYFLAYPFREKVISSGIALEVHLRGLRPLHPAEEPGIPGGWAIKDDDIRAQYTRGDIRDSYSQPIPQEFRVAAQRIDSLQPTLRWEAFSGTNVTYDLNIWRAGRLAPEAVVYSRSGIPQPSHELEHPLDPSTLYYWSVRTHFTENGKPRITDWSRRSVKHTLLIKIMTAGIAALLDPIADGFYVFITPAVGSNRTDSTTPQTKWFPWGNWPLSRPDNTQNKPSAE